MRPSRQLSSLGLLLLLTCPGLSRGQSSGSPMVSGAGLVDFASRGGLKPGMWVRYNLSTTKAGRVFRGSQTLLVSGSEIYKGERCVWIETLFTPEGAPTQYARTLVSMKIKGAPNHDFRKAIPYFQRKVQTMKSIGGQVEELVFPEVRAAAKKLVEGSDQRLKDVRDTLPSTDVATDAGKFRCLPCRFRRDGRFVVPDRNGQSASFHQQHEEQIDYRCAEVPVTGLVEQRYKYVFKDATIPVNSAPDFDPPAELQGYMQEAVLTAFGTTGKPVFPKAPKTVPMNIPMQDVTPPKAGADSP